MKKLSLSLSLIFIFSLYLLSPIAVQAGNLNATGTDFGNVYIPDEVPVQQQVTLNRQGGAPAITINSVSSFGGDNPGDFTIDMDDCTGMNVPGPCDITISFSPGGFFMRSATITINATGADNTEPPSDGDLVVTLTGNGEGCGDGIRQAAFEVCDFEDPASAGCCDTSCEAANDAADCNAGGCIVGGSCNTGFCEGGMDADAGTPCDDGNQCITGEVCDGSGTCQGGDPVVCPEPGECKVSLGCDPLAGCQEGNAPAGTSCGEAGSGDVCNAEGVCVSGGSSGGDSSGDSSGDSGGDTGTNSGDGCSLSPANSSHQGQKALTLMMGLTLVSLMGIKRKWLS